jgi:hypothetical protein
MTVSFPHEGFIELVRNRPDLVVDLLTRSLHVEVPRFTRVQLIEAALNEVAPVEHFADALVILAAEDQPVLGVIVEAQLRRDDRKHYTWPQYAMNARARHECPCIVVVVTTSRRVARWASQPIDVGNGTVFRQRIIGPQSIPKLTDPGRVAREPELAVLSAMAHGRRNTPIARRIAVAAFTGLSRLPDDDQRLLYSLLVERSLSVALRKALEMQADIRKYMSASQRRSYDKAKAEGELKGRAEGELKGRAEGELKGRAEGKAEAVLTILAKRGLSVTPRQRRKIRGCIDLATLDRWLERALSVASVDQLLG